MAAPLPWTSSGPQDTEEFCSAYDDLPLWSAPFGLALLERVRLRGVGAALDVGCGAGFPLLELAERLGREVRVVGVDPWWHALERASHKRRVRLADQVAILAGSAQELPFAGGSFDLIVSNNGLNNVPDPGGAVAEIARVARPGAQVLVTVNLPETMRELYDAFDALLADRGLDLARGRMREHIAAKREPALTWTGRFERHGFRIVAAPVSRFRYRFASARALFTHSFIRAAFLPHWLEVLAGEVRPEPFLDELGRRLEQGSADSGCVALDVPFLCLEATRG